MSVEDSPSRTHAGRPSLPQHSRKTDVILVRLTAHDRKRAEHAAQATGQTLSAFIRGAILSSLASSGNLDLA